MRKLLAASLACCLLWSASAQMPGMRVGIMLPLRLSQGGMGGEGTPGLLMMLPMNQHAAGAAGAAGGAGVNSMLPRLMMMGNAGPSEMMMNQSGGGHGVAGGIAINPMLPRSLLGLGDQMVKVLQLVMLNRQLPAAAGAANGGQAPTSGDLSN